MQPAGVSKRVRRLVLKRDAPSMAGLNDIADYLGGGASESEGEDTAARVVLTQAQPCLVTVPGSNQ